ncbi:Inner membrane protein ybaL [uncultured Eubacterium sp.]|uniref:cation:proton antiporter domain-containing protein n=1 Tax=Brotomerdimonas butyrica TaxID=2981721 RepID=UPI000821C368|nr:cation:proton antiporter [Brotomerdimonas butyrica]MCU6756342.1 cation:proton antiporter [Brotomerdimonas butyrica]SCH79977.1 Inner membrane protein ybaL [uncultured Eubacterium sp.]
MHLDNLISDLALILIVAGIVTLIFRKIKLPVVLGYIVAGFLISPHFSYMPTVVEVADIEVWANIGVVFLMFGLGLEFSFKKLATVGGSAVIVAMTVMLSMIFIGAGVGYMLGWAKMDCIFLGGMLSMSSTMIILKAYEEYDLKERRFAQLVLSTLVIEDIAGIFMMIILSTISVSQAASGVATFKEIGLLLMYLVIWLILGIYLIPSFLNKVSKLMNDELMVIVSLAICLGMVVIADFIGFSEALGAFMAGSILAGTVRAGYIERLTKPIKDLFGAVFFVSVGMMIQPELLVKYIGPILIITVATILGQMIFSTIGILLSGQSLHTAIRGGFSMVQIGEFSFIIATLGSSLGVISDFLYPVVVCVSVITTFTTPLFIKNSASVYKFLDEKLPDKLWVFIKKNTSEDRSNKDKDEDWSKYIKKVLSRTLICSVVMYIIYWLGIQELKPLVDTYVSSEIFADLITAVVTCGVMIPFISMMHGTNDALFIKLWLKQRSNKLPLLTLKTVRILIAACFVTLVLRKIYHIPFVILLLLSAAAVVLLIRSDYLKGVTINMELRFMENFSERTLAKQKRERGRDEKYSWLNEELLVAEFQVTDTVENKTIYDFTKSRAFRVTIIKIIRGDKYINLPTPDEVVLEGDILHMMGTSAEIDACTILLEKDECIEYTDRDDITLKDYIYGQTFYGIAPEKQLICCPINVSQGSEFSRKSIKNSHMRDKYRGTIIGIERGNLTILNVDIDTIIQPGDLIWTLGGKQMADLLIKGNVLDSV